METTRYWYRHPSGTEGATVDEARDASSARYARILQRPGAVVLRFVHCAGGRAECLHCGAAVSENAKVWALNHMCKGGR